MNEEIIAGENTDFEDSLINNMTGKTTVFKSSMSKKEREELFNKMIQSSLSGEIHTFDETMSKETIHKKLDDLFGW